MTERIDQRALDIFGPDFSACVQRTLSRLRRQFPGAFKEVRPLALGIRDEIVAQTTFTEEEVVRFLTFYTRSPAYLRAQAEPGAMRHDLRGKVTEPVSTENRQYAADRLKFELESRRERLRYLGFRAALMQPVAIEPDDRGGT